MRLLPVIATLLFLLFPAQLAAQDLYFEPNPELRMEAWLLQSAEEADSARTASGVTGLLGGAVLMVQPFVLAALPGGEPMPGEEASFQFLTISSLMFGASALATGIASLVLASPDETRYQRFRLAQSRGLTPVELARFEGELRADAEHARWARHLNLVSSLVMSAVGATSVGVSFLEQVGEHQRISLLAGGGALLGVGLLLSLLSLVPTGAEDRWDTYAEGLAPTDDDSFDIAVAPSVSDSGAGFQITGSF